MINPILASSARRRLRGARFHILVLAAMALSLGVALYAMSGMIRSPRALSAYTEGLRAYAALVGVETLLLALVAPAMTGAAIAGERERQTLELLLVTRTGAFRIVSGKLLESFALLLLLQWSTLPAQGLCVLSGCVTLQRLLVTQGFLAAFALLAASLGVFCSTLSRHTMTAVILSLLALPLLLFLLSLPAFLGYPQRVTDVLYDSRRYAEMTEGQAMAMMGPVLLANPGVSLFSLLESGTGAFQELFLWRGWGRILATYKLIDRVETGKLVLLGMAGMAVLSVLLVALSALLLRPVSAHVRGRKGKKS